MSALSPQAFDLALRQWLIRGRPWPACAAVRRLPAAPAGAVITCAWQPTPGQRSSVREQELTAWLVSSALQHWARQVTGSVWGQTASGTGLLLVPVHAQAQETAQALRRFLDAAVQALGGGVGMGDWDFRVIGPLTPGSARQVAHQLARRGWPIS